MTILPADSALFGGLFADPDIAGLFADEAVLRSMLEVEAALARVQARLGIVPGDAAARIAQVAASFEPDIAAIARETESSGVPVIPLVAQLRDAVGGPAADWVHWGATSQDIVDTALVLRLREALNRLDVGLAKLGHALAPLADAHRGTVTVAHTRSQQALPTSFGLKVAVWLAPLADHAARLEQLRPRLLAVQFGAAAGTLAALGGQGVELMETLAAELGLAAPVAPWHVRRDSLVELAGWLSLVSGSLGKMAQDIILLSRSEAAELRTGSGGGSSTMPQKANPVACEAIVTLARMNATLLSGMHQSLIHGEERDGAAWQLEWVALPQMVAATGAALNHARAVAGAIEPDAGRMRANLEASGGLVLAEAASFALSGHMPRREAQTLVKQACATAAEEGRPLFEILAARTDAPVDWAALADPANYLGAADELIDRILARHRTRHGD